MTKCKLITILKIRRKSKVAGSNKLHIFDQKQGAQKRPAWNTYHFLT
jgi:hypothetical protein